MLAAGRNSWRRRAWQVGCSLQREKPAAAQSRQAAGERERWPARRQQHQQGCWGEGCEGCRRRWKRPLRQPLLMAQQVEAAGRLLLVMMAAPAAGMMARGADSLQRAGREEQERLPQQAAVRRREGVEALSARTEPTPSPAERPQGWQSPAGGRHHHHPGAGAAAAVRFASATTSRRLCCSLRRP